MAKILNRLNQIKNNFIDPGGWLFLSFGFRICFEFRASDFGFSILEANELGGQCQSTCF
jgi:hypothetical protein